ncbi:Type II secretion system F domain protein [Ammonifex degensii KC4]|uniref:Type II secretion system F domain protein n=1 Tax=Ammonifex degensii (strain DSM 10501 / KC4) TaxID=429009 RepID=C9RD48_AMMDK|nr:type II secretion system F family protein [Ammonifex degensii]ACX52175.1 Type II secretion system F domain protein [Ammonifex degensii KC4]
MVISFSLFASLLFLILAWKEQREELRRAIWQRLSESKGGGARVFSWRERLQGGLKALLEASSLTSRLRARLERELSQADLPLRGEEFLLMQLVFFFGGGWLGYAGIHSFLGAIAGAALGGLVPFLYLRHLRRQRLARFQSQLPDALSLMANTMRAGFGMLQAMDVVRREMPPPISQEFGRTLAELGLGMGVEEALERLSHRVPSDDLDLAVTAVIIQRQVGGNLAEILDNIATTIRERVRLKGEIRALTAQGRISALIIGLLPLALALILSLINPSYLLTLIYEPLGRIMLGLGAAGEIVGVLLLRKITEVEF